MKAIIEGPYGEFAKMDAVKQVAMMRALRGKDEDVRVKMDELAAKDGEIQQLQQQLEQAQVCCFSMASVLFCEGSFYTTLHGYLPPLQNLYAVCAHIHSSSPHP